MTPRDAQILSQWFSPNFPTGSFSFSHGLDTLFDRKLIQDPEELKEALRMILEQGGGRNDAILIAQSYQGREIHVLGLALAGSYERKLETLMQGENFARAINALHALDLPPQILPAVVGKALRALELPLEAGIVYYLQNYISNLAMIAARLIPLGQIETQKMIRDLLPNIEKIAQQTINADIKDLSSSTFMIDMAAIAHETQEIRLCKT